MITLLVHRLWDVLKVEIQPTTTGKYAAVRIAEACGLDPEVRYRLIISQGGSQVYSIPDDDIVADFDGATAWLTH